MLLVDDDSLVADSLRLVIPKNWKMTVSTRVADVPKDGFFHAAMIDQHLTGNLQYAEGTEVIKTVRARFPKTEIVAISGNLDLNLMETCLENGATKFLAKPLLPDEVRATLEKIEALWMLREIEQRPSSLKIQWVGSSPASDQVRQQVARLRGERGPILIEGETGTGKEVISRLLQQQDPGRPFVAVHVGAIPENLFESEMFGHTKGAFTGADTMKVGLAEAAQGGDLFLDEIEALPLNQQVKLLRFLETGEVRKVGAKEAIQVKARVIAATNQNLEQMVKEGKFREDLLFRLKSHKLILPPLRERTQDVEELAKFFLSQERPRSNKMLTAEAIEALQNYSFPGNVRELKRICEQLSLTCPLPKIRAEDVNRLLGPSVTQDLNLDSDMGLNERVERFEAQVIRQTLRETGSVEGAVEKLQVSRSNLYKKMKDYGIEI